MIGRNMISIDYNFFEDLLLIWIVVIITSFLTCLIPCIKVYKQNVRSVILNS